MSSEDIREIYTILRAMQADIAAIKAAAEGDRTRLDKLEEKCDKESAILNRQLGKDGALGVLYGFIGAIIVAVVSWVLSFVKGAANG